MKKILHGLPHFEWLSNNRAARIREGLLHGASFLMALALMFAGHGQLVPRQAAIKAGIPASVDGYALDMVCSSGMMAVMNAATLIKAGEAELVLAGGTESMSQAAFALPHRARWGYQMVPSGSTPMYDTLIHDGLTDPIAKQSMGDETERLGNEYSVTRTELDWVAFESHRRAAAATAAGYA